ncbi:MAG: hypothetical protein KDJ83_07900, partial [Rhodobacteraceae bacterium]|nr:hypothetical protein [Paracoccaceae bacterium]
IIGFPLVSRYAKRPAAETNQTARISLHLNQSSQRASDNIIGLRLYLDASRISLPDFTAAERAREAPSASVGGI